MQIQNDKNNDATQGRENIHRELEEQKNTAALKSTIVKEKGHVEELEVQLALHKIYLDKQMGETEIELSLNYNEKLRHLKHEFKKRIGLERSRIEARWVSRELDVLKQKELDHSRALDVQKNALEKLSVQKIKELQTSMESHYAVMLSKEGVQHPTRFEKASAQENEIPHEHTNSSLWEVKKRHPLARANHESKMNEGRAISSTKLTQEQEQEQEQLSKRGLLSPLQQEAQPQQQHTTVVFEQKRTQDCTGENTGEFSYDDVDENFLARFVAMV